MREPCSTCGETKPIGGSCPFCAVLIKKGKQRQPAGRQEPLAKFQLPVLPKLQLPALPKFRLPTPPEIKIPEIKIPTVPKIELGTIPKIALASKLVQKPSRQASVGIGIIGVLVVAILLIRLLPGTVTLEGGAWLQKGNGDSELLRGLPIIVCSAPKVDVGEVDIVQAVKEAGINPRWRKDSWSRHYTYFYEKQDLVDETFKYLAPTIANRKKGAVETDIDGKFKITGLTPGPHVVIAELKTNYILALWCLPVDLNFGTNSLNLNSTNATVIETDR